MFSQERSKTNSGIINIFEKIIRNHPLLYYIARSFVRHTNIFEEDANGVKFLKFNKAINVIDVGASDGIASKFFNQNLNVKKIVCYEPNELYVKTLRKLNMKNLIIKPYAIGNKNESKKIFFPRYTFFSKNLDLIPYTYYNKKTLITQLKLDFKFLKNLKIIEKKLSLRKISKFNLKIDLIKIDVNDNGLSVVKCLHKIIKLNKPALLIETDVDINQIDDELKKLGYDKFSYSTKNNSFSRVNKKFPLNTYFLQKKHF
jgi:FkbM family methyltransferase